MQKRISPRKNYKVRHTKEEKYNQAKLVRDLYLAEFSNQSEKTGQDDVQESGRDV